MSKRINTLDLAGSACAVCGRTHRDGPWTCAWASVDPPICSMCEGNGRAPVLLAIDPSALSTGWAVMRGSSKNLQLIASDTWHPSRARGAEDRLVQLGHVRNAVLVYHARHERAIEQRR